MFHFPLGKVELCYLANSIERAGLPALAEIGRPIVLTSFVRRGEGNTLLTGYKVIDGCFGKRNSALATETMILYGCKAFADALANGPFSALGQSPVGSVLPSGGLGTRCLIRDSHETRDNEPDTMLVCFCAYGQQDRVVWDPGFDEQQSTRGIPSYTLLLIVIITSALTRSVIKWIATLLFCHVAIVTEYTQL